MTINSLEELIEAFLNHVHSGTDNSQQIPAANLPSSLPDPVTIAHGGTGQTTKASAYDALSPNTTKGDISVYSTTNARLAVGSNNQVIIADSAQTLGVKWGAIPDAITTTAVPQDINGTEQLRISNDTLSVITDSSYRDLKHSSILHSGTVRVKFTLVSANNATLCFGKIYKNGVATGTERSTTLAAGVEFTEDITVAAGDELEIYAHSNGVSQVQIKNFRIYCDMTTDEGYATYSL